MARYVTLSRAARLAGVSRGAIQKRIRSGDLTTFEGMVEVNELLRVYPDTQMEETALLQRVEEIMESAVNKVVRNKPTLPDAEILAARVGALSHELAQTKAELASYHALIDRITRKLDDAVSHEELPVREFTGALQAWFTRALKQREEFSEVPQQLLAREAFLRIMEASVKVFPSGREFPVQGRDTLLESALKAGQVPSYGCSDGSCGKCRARLVSGKVRKVRSYNGAADEEGTVLMCSHTAMTDLVIEIEEADDVHDIEEQSLHAQVKSVERRPGDVMLVNLKMPHSQRLRFLAGQSARLEIGDTCIPDSFIASCPCEERDLQFHFSLPRNREFVDRVMRALENAESVLITGPNGKFTLKEESARPTVFIAFGLGFAPVKSVLEHAMSVDSKESVSLYWFAEESGHYMDNLCRAWADAIDDFNYQPVILDSISSQDKAENIGGRVCEILASDGISLKASDFYIAAPGFLMPTLIERLVECGMSLGDAVIQETD